MWKACVYCIVLYCIVCRAFFSSPSAAQLRLYPMESTVTPKEDYTKIQVSKCGYPARVFCLVLQSAFTHRVSMMLYPVRLYGDFACKEGWQTESLDGMLLLFLLLLLLLLLLLSLYVRGI